MVEIPKTNLSDGMQTAISRYQKKHGNKIGPKLFTQMCEFCESIRTIFYEEPFISGMTKKEKIRIYKKILATKFKENTSIANFFKKILSVEDALSFFISMIVKGSDGFEITKSILTYVYKRNPSILTESPMPTRQLESGEKNSGKKSQKTRGVKSARRAKAVRPEKTMKRAGSARTGETLNTGRSECFRRGKVKEPGKAKIREVKLPKLW